MLGRRELKISGISQAVKAFNKHGVCISLAKGWKKEDKGSVTWSFSWVLFAGKEVIMKTERKLDVK